MSYRVGMKMASAVSSGIEGYVIGSSLGINPVGTAVVLGLDRGAIQPIYSGLTKYIEFAAHQVAKPIFGDAIGRRIASTVELAARTSIVAGSLYLLGYSSLAITSAKIATVACAILASALVKTIIPVEFGLSHVPAAIIRGTLLGVNPLVLSVGALMDYHLPNFDLPFVDEEGLSLPLQRLAACYNGAIKATFAVGALHLVGLVTMQDVHFRVTVAAGAALFSLATH